MMYFVHDADSTVMKLAEALSIRSDLQQRLYQLDTRLANNSKVQEGEEPSESPGSLLSELDSMTTQLEELIWRINQTNGVTTAPDGRTLTQLIARRDVLTRKAEMLRSFLDSASSTVSRHSASEIRVVSTVDVRELRRTVDSVSEEVRRIDMTIQELNWTTELV